MQSKLFSFCVLAAGCVMYALVSPKWTLPGFAWLWPSVLLYYTRFLDIRKKYLGLFLCLSVSQYIAGEGVMPMPCPVTAVLSCINAGIITLVFMLDRWVISKKDNFLSTLAFPVFFVAKEALDATGAGGSWWAAGNTQYAVSWLVQLSSIAGVMGLSFLLYWFGSVVCWAVIRAKTSRPWHGGAVFYTGVLTTIIVYGILHASSQQKSGSRHAKVAGITVPNSLLLDALSRDFYHVGMEADPRISPGSPKMQRLNTAMASFIESPGNGFPRTLDAVKTIEDSLFALSTVAANRGAQIIVWTEAAALIPRFMYENLISRAVSFTRQHDVYLLLTTGVFDTGKITSSKMFLENEAILLAPGGKIQSVFHKNFPVPFAERSVPGDGVVPVVETPFGRVAISICYDADMPFNMRQLGRKSADLLLLPSGDWYNIAPYHSYMAIFRAVENGCSLFRQASGGLSVAATNTGTIVGASDYFKSPGGLWIGDIAIGSQDTLFNKGGYLFPAACAGIALVLFCALLTIEIRNKPRRSKI